KKAFVILEPLLHAILRKSIALTLRHSLCSLQNILVRETRYFLPAKRSPGCLITLITVSLPQSNRLVVQAVVQCLRKRQNMLDFDLITYQHFKAYLSAAIWAAPLQGVEAQLLPQNPLFDQIPFDLLFADTQNTCNLLTIAFIS